MIIIWWIRVKEWWIVKTIYVFSTLHLNNWHSPWFLQYINLVFRYTWLYIPNNYGFILCHENINNTNDNTFMQFKKPLFFLFMKHEFWIMFMLLFLFRLKNKKVWENFCAIWFSSIENWSCLMRVLDDIEWNH